MVKVNKKTILDYWLKILDTKYIDKIVINTHYKHNKIFEFVNKHKLRNKIIEMFIETEGTCKPTNQYKNWLFGQNE
mgnify:CR=1 FL=1